MLKAHIILVRISVVRIRVLCGFWVLEVHSHKKSSLVHRHIHAKEDPLFGSSTRNSEVLQSNQ